jgi:hypothetical protein
MVGFTDRNKNRRSKHLPMRRKANKFIGEFRQAVRMTTNKSIERSHPGKPQRDAHLEQ